MNDLPAGWISTELSEVLSEIIGGGTPNKANLEYFKGHIPFMTVKDMKTYYPDDTLDKISNEALRDSSAKLIPADTLIISTRMGLGKICRTPFATAINQDLKALFINDAVSKDFLFYWYINNARLIESLGKGTTVKGIRLEILRSLKLILPPLNEQKRIADKLDQIFEGVDNAKAHLVQIPAIMQYFRDSVLQSMVTGKLINLEKDIYEEWPLQSLENICNKITDGTHHSPKSYETGEYEYVTAKNIKFYGVDLSNITYVSRQVHEEIYKRCPVELGDVLYIKDGATTGLACVNQLDREFSLLSSVALLKPKEDILLGEYLCYLMNSPDFRREAIEKMGGSAIKRLTLTKIKNLKVRIPNIREQKELVKKTQELLALADQIEGKYNSAMENFEKIKHAALAKAFRGELVPQDPNDEPAHALLERIKVEEKLRELDPKQKSRKFTKRDQEIRGMVSSVIETLKKENKPLTAQSLLHKSGYPLDADPEKIEEFFLDIRNALREGSIICERINDEDIFRLAA